VAIIHTVVEHLPHPLVIVRSRLTHVGCHREVVHHLVVAVLHRGAVQGGEQLGLEDRVQIVIIGSSVATQTKRPGINAKDTPWLY